MNGGEAHSAEAVRDRIREMIERRRRREILSDDRIVALLTADGVEYCATHGCEISRGDADPILGRAAQAQVRADIFHSCHRRHSLR